MAVGKCRLTGGEGKFVDSHLIPRALTKHHAPGKPFIQTRGLLRPIRRQTSWYDPGLVIREGEDVLAKHDGWAIQELRKHRLIWDSWGLRRQLSASDHELIDGTPYGLRHIEGIDPDKFRLFFLSLLWRAAATDMQEFREVHIDAADIEILRGLVVDQNPGDPDFFPITLMQLSTRGPQHNHAPIAQNKVIPALGGQPAETVPIFRFYFDGLIAHFTRDFKPGFSEAYLGPQAVGHSSKLLIPTVTYNASFQNENLSELMREAEERWPVEMAKLYRAAGLDPK